VTEPIVGSERVLDNRALKDVLTKTLSCTMSNAHSRFAAAIMPPTFSLSLNKLGRICEAHAPGVVNSGHQRVSEN
jgi:hypothetical protein